MPAPFLARLPALAVAIIAIVGGCAPDDGAAQAPLSDYDALFEGAPSNEELPFEIKSDAPPPRLHTELLALQSPVKSQGSRGVCSIFSTVALMEHLYLSAGVEDPDFSEQYLQWSAKFEVRSFPNTSGSNASSNLQAINRFGVPHEGAWPYEPLEWGAVEDPACGAEEERSKPTRCFTNGEPPPRARDAEKFHLPKGRWLSTRPAAIMDHIQVTGTAVVVGVDFFYQSWNHDRSTLPRNDEYWSQGIVLYPNDEDVDASHEQRAGHSILVVGWDRDLEIQVVDADGNKVFDDDGEPVVERGFYIFKNSWGADDFGVDNPHGPGYGFISMSYVEDYGNAQVSDVPDVVLPPVDSEDDVLADGETFEMTEGVDIPDADSAGIVSVIDVPAGDPVERLTVDVTIAHPFRGDLSVRLRHDDEVVSLHERTGGGQSGLELSVELDAFTGVDREGTWALEVVDHAKSDVGRLEAWTLTFHP